MSKDEKIIVDDFIVLDNAVPDEISDHRFTVCTAGYSPKHGLIRIYPVPPNANMRRWNVMEIPLQRTSNDTRIESWKVQDSRTEWKKLSEKIRIVDSLKSKQDKLKLVQKLHSEYGVKCVEDLNSRCLSLGMVKPTILGYNLEKRKEYDPYTQTTLDSMNLFLTRDNYAFVPKITYRCNECRSKKPHKQQVVEWGLYEWMRNHPENLAGMWENVRINDVSWNKTFLVGNQARYRNSFLIISVFRFKTI
jgi:hypothetical protein